MEVFAILILLVIILAAILSLWLLVVLLYTKVPFVKMPAENIPIVLQHGGITSSDIVVDLGCGDAEMLIEIEKATQAKTIGYELSPVAYMLAKRNIRRKHARTKVFFKNFFQADFDGVTVVFVFLITGVMKKTAHFLKATLPKGTRVFSYGFDFPDWKPYAVYESKTNKSKLFAYRIP